MRSAGRRTKLKNAFGNTVDDLRKHPEDNRLGKAVKDATFDDLYRWGGTGEKTWQAVLQ